MLIIKVLHLTESDFYIPVVGSQGNKISYTYSELGKKK